MDPEGEHRKLLDSIQRKGSMLVAFSGGVDSTLLAVLAKDSLAERTRCIFLDSPVVPRAAVAEALAIATAHGLTLETIPIPLMQDEAFTKNTADRCYRCKKICAPYLKKRAAELGFTCIADGMNVSDMQEHRPGLMASTEEGIAHPFIETCITKENIRAIARQRGLSVWQKPSAACLASRIPYGEPITKEKLCMIESAEVFLARKGFSPLRVRIHGTIARIEVSPDDLHRLLADRHDVTKNLRSIGFSYITLDLDGYRTGSMDEVL